MTQKAFNIIVIIVIFVGIRNEVVTNNRRKIMKAICNHYHYARMSRTPFVNIRHSEMEPYFRTYFRLWDWGYTRIVPPEVFEKIKPYIER